MNAAASVPRGHLVVSPSSGARHCLLLLAVALACGSALGACSTEECVQQVHEGCPSHIVHDAPTAASLPAIAGEGECEPRCVVYPLAQWVASLDALVLGTIAAITYVVDPVETSYGTVGASLSECSGRSYPGVLLDIDVTEVLHGPPAERVSVNIGASQLALFCCSPVIDEEGEEPIWRSGCREECTPLLRGRRILLPLYALGPPATYTTLTEPLMALHPTGDSYVAYPQVGFGHCSEAIVGLADGVPLAELREVGNLGPVGCSHHRKQVQEGWLQSLEETSRWSALPAGGVCEK